MTEVATLASGVRAENRYDANLSYEERARLRREKRRQQESKPQLSIDLKSKVPYRSQSPTYCNHSSSSPSLSPSPIILNGTLNGPISPLVESADRSLTVATSSINSNFTNNMFNGNARSNSPVGSRNLTSASFQQRTQVSSGSGTKSEFDRRRYHSTPPESTIGLPKSTPPQASLADSREQPVAVGVASSNGQGPYRHQVNSDTAAGQGGRPESPHSPVVKKHASLHLAGIIGRQQERERSCTPSPCTPTLTKFSFPLPDVGDSNSSTLASIRVSETTLPSEKAARLMNLGRSSPREQSTDGGNSATTDSYKVTAHDDDGGHPQKPKAFAEGLKFIDTPDLHDDGPDATPKMITSAAAPPPSMTSLTTTTTTTTGVAKMAKSPAKTQIVFRPLDEVHAEDITVISGCKFFDPSQSQTDYYTPPPPLHQISSVSESRGEGDRVMEGKDKGKKSKSKESKSSIKLKRNNSSGKMLESTPEPEEKANVDNGDETPKPEPKFSKKKEKEEKAGKKLSPKKKRSISMSEADVGTGSLPSSLLASPSKPPLPTSASAKSSLKKASASFRGDGRDHSLSPDSAGGLVMNKRGTPNLSSPAHSSSRGTTPDSSTSESEDHKRKPSLRNKLKSLMGKDKNSGKTIRSSWRFSEVGGVAQHDSDEVVALKGFRKLNEDGEMESPPSLTPVHHNKSYSLVSTRSASQLSLLTHADRLTMEEDTEMVPRTYSMECIYPSYNERCVDVPAIGEKLNDDKSTNGDGTTKKDQNGDSGSSEYMTASDSGSVNRLTAEAAINETRLSVPATNSAANLSQDTSSEKFVTPPESTGHSQTSMELSIIGILDKALSCPDTAIIPNPKSTSKISSSPKTSGKKSSLGTTTTKGPSLRGSPITSRKASSKLASPLGRKVPSTPSPIGSKKSSSATPSSPSPIKKTSSSSGKVSPKTSPVSARSSTTGKKVTTSPLAQKRVAATTTASPGSSPISSRKSASTKASLTSPLATRRVSPSKAPTASPKSSPLLKRKITPGSPRSSFGHKPSPPMMSRTGLDSTASSKLSPRTSSFSRFGQGRTPIKVKSIKEAESPSEKMQRIREKRKSLSKSKLLQENISASCPTTPQPSRPRPEPPSDLTLSQPTKAGSESPHSSECTSPSRKRKLGVSMPASPLVEIPPTLPEVRTPSPTAQPVVVPKELNKETSVVDDEPISTSSINLGFDVDSLLSSVGVQLDQLGGGEETTTVKQPLKLQPFEDLPEIASMPAMVFTSPIHSRQSSLDIEGEHDSIPTSPLNHTAPKPKRPAPPPPVAATGKNSKKSSAASKKSTSSSLAPKSPSATRKLTEPSLTASKKSKSGVRIPKTKLSIPSKRNSKDQLSPVLEKKESPKSSPSALKKKTSAPLSTGKTESTQKFTSARPPRPPMMSRLPSDPTVRASGAGRPSTAPTASTTISSTGQKRPRNIVTGRPSTVGAVSAQKPPPGSSPSIGVSSSSSDSMKSKSASSLSIGSNKSRSGLRASGRAKRISTTTHNTPLHNARPGQAAESVLHPKNVGRQSMKSKSAALLRPGSAVAGGSARKGSLAANEIEKVSPARKSMRRVSSGELLPRKIKPGASATLTRDRKISQASSTASGGSSSVYSSGKANTLTRPRSSSNAGLSRTPATRSMRISRGSSGRKSTTTAPRAPMLTRKATPPSTGGLLSPTRKNSTMKRTSSAGEVLAAFDHISAQAQGSMLVGSDHRRNIRPKFRQKASSAHLKILGSREGVTSELVQPTDDDDSKLDPNAYSTYMAKKNLAPSAMAGLAAKLDFTTVKLRKTGIVDKMIAQQAGLDPVNILASPNPSAGNEHNTVHPIMLLKVKGRRHIQTRLVEPSGSSLNSGDVFIIVAEDKLFHWVGKSANVIEKARGSDIVMRILHKKELGSCATSAAVLKEEESSVNSNTRKGTAFWEVLGGKKAVKGTESVPSDEIYEKAVNMATVVYQLQGEAEKTQFVPIHENVAKMLQVSVLHPTRILLFDFVNEVYVWIGKQSPPAMRRKAVALGKKIFDAGCRPPVFNLRSSPARQSGRYRPRSSTTKSPRHSILNSSGRRSSRATKSDIKPRPDWALFARTTEGAESILFREKFCDWPEPGRIIKMKGHVSSGEVMTPPPSVELQPADVDKMVKPIPAFEGLRLEGDNIHRGQGNYKVSRSTFACNRVRTNGITKWVIKEFDNVEVPNQDIGVFYTSEAYVIRWAFTITVVRELEGIIPGEGMFARDRKYQRSLQAKREERLPAAPADDKDSKAEKRARSELSDSEASDVDEDDECKRILESGGRERCAYFFWQGGTSTVNEKGASALMTVELDKEKGPQVRVVQSKEPPAFLNLFNGSMILLKGRSETNSLQCRERDCRVFYTKVQMKSEACLVEITPDDEELPLSSFLRSRGCLVFYHIPANKLYLWQGSKATVSLKKSSYAASKALRNRLVDVELILVTEGDESNDFWNLAGDKKLYHSLASESRAHNYTPRLFELSSSTGEFTASEFLSTTRNNDSKVEAFPFQQSDLYSTVQPAIFLLDANYEVYVWLGWWPEEKNKLLREANATTGSAHARWLRDKKLALQTAQSYIKACNRIRTPRAFMVSAGSEHDRFVDLFPSWEVNRTVQELNCKGIIRVVPRRVDIEDELLKYERTRFSLDILKEKPLPEGVDPARLETYLSDEEFKKVFKMDKEQFSKLPAWKQTKNKKEVGLF